MKLDMGAAWSNATAMLSANRDVVLVVAGVFFFLPYLALTLLVPQAVQPAPPTADLDTMMEMMSGVYLDYWWAFLLTSILQGIGMLALLTLLTDRARPTVGEALKRGGIALIPYLVAQIMVAFSIALLVAIPIAVAAASGSAAIAFILGLLALVGAVYLFVKFSLNAPVIAIEGVLNPLKVLGRSWQITKGNSFRLLMFYVLLFVAVIVVVLIVTMVLGVIFAAVGGQMELIGNGVVSSALNSVVAVIFLAVFASVHRQLAGPSAEAVSETFE